MQNKRLKIILLIALCILLIPLVAMLFTDEVNWNLTDFLVGGILLIGSGLLIELILRLIKNKKSRIIISAAILLALFLIWGELAVGLFGTPFAGN